MEELKKGHFFKHAVHEKGDKISEDFFILCHLHKMTKKYTYEKLSVFNRQFFIFWKMGIKWRDNS